MAVPSAARAPLRRLLALARPEARALAAGTLFLVLGSAAALLFPLAIRLLVDGAMGQGRAGLLGAGPGRVERAAVAMALLALVQGAAVALRFAFFTLAGERIVLRLREQLHRAVLAQEIGFFDQTRTGDLLGRLGSDAQVVQGAVSGNLSAALRNLVVAAGGLALLAATSPRLTLLMVAVVPPVALGAMLWGGRIRRLTREVQAALASAGDVAEESIAGIRTVRAFDAEEAEGRRYGAALRQVFAVARRRVVAASALTAAVQAGVFASAAAVLFYGGRLVARGELTVGALTSFLVYTLFVALALASLADAWAELMRAAGAAERVFDVVDRVPRVASAGGVVPERVEGRLTLEGVSFAYPARPGARVLDGVDLAVQPGELVALVGPSGAGKSTVAALVARLYDPDGGVVRLDGRDVRELDPRWLRRQVGAVWQEPVLFSATVAENIRYGRPGASDAEVEAAARAAHAHEFIAQLPEGYATPAGERGARLSGGQRQRIAIARALLKDPRVLVLDEATSALDAESERLVRDALERLMRGRATLVIAHRLSTVVHADRVVVLEAGRVVQRGTHRALLEEDGLYRRLVERQFVAV